MVDQLTTRIASEQDIESIRMIYNQGIEDRIATLETEQKESPYMINWFEQHKGRYKVLAAEQNGEVIGWASLNQYSNRCAYNGVADLSVYIRRDFRGKGIGTKLLQDIESLAIQHQFNKIILFTFSYIQYLFKSLLNIFVVYFSFKSLQIILFTSLSFLYCIIYCINYF